MYPKKVVMVMKIALRGVAYSFPDKDAPTLIAPERMKDFKRKSTSSGEYGFAAGAFGPVEATAVVTVPCILRSPRTAKAVVAAE